MGDFPADRLKIARNFTMSGVDCAGPFTIRCTNHCSSKDGKQYAAFFVCLLSRAVHIKSIADTYLPKVSLQLLLDSSFFTTSRTRCGRVMPPTLLAQKWNLKKSRIYKHSMEIYSSPFAASWRRLGINCESWKKSSSLCFTRLDSYRRPAQDNANDKSNLS